MVNQPRRYCDAMARGRVTRVPAASRYAVRKLTQRSAKKKKSTRRSNQKETGAGSTSKPMR